MSFQTPDEAIETVIESGRELEADIEEALVEWDDPEVTERLLEIALDDDF